MKEAIRAEAQRDDERLTEILRTKEAEVSSLTEELATKDRQIRALTQDVHDGRGVMKRKTTEAGGKNKALTAETSHLKKRLKKSEAEAVEMRGLVKGYAGLQKTVEELQAAVEAQRREATSARRWLLVLPVLLVMYAVLSFMRGEWRSVPAWLALAVGLAPFIRGAGSKLRGREWEWIGRAANLLGILVFAWQYVPGVKEGVKTLLGRFGLQ
jgi:hypothetical protein